MKNWRQQQFEHISAAKDEATITLFMVHGVCIFGSRQTTSDDEHEHDDAGHERGEHDIRVSIGTKSHCCCY